MSHPNELSSLSGYMDLTRNAAIVKAMLSMIPWIAMVNLQCRVAQLLHRTKSQDFSYPSVEARHSRGRRKVSHHITKDHCLSRTKGLWDIVSEAVDVKGRPHLLRTAHQMGHQPSRQSLSRLAW